MARLPRRAAQRQTLGHGQDGAPPIVLPSGEEPPRSFEPRVKMNQRNLKRRHRRRKSVCPNVGESGPDSDSEVDRNSGYNSQPERESDPEYDADAIARYYQQKMDEFEKAGVTVSNPCDETKAIMEAELERWEM
jgi:hypothetical protein